MRFYCLGYKRDGHAAYINLDNVSAFEICKNEDKAEENKPCWFLAFIMTDGTKHYSSYMDYHDVEEDIVDIQKR